jgi:predicted phosphate transport protein (TIGR00153 family)
MRFTLIPRDPGFYPLFEAAAANARAAAERLQTLLRALPVEPAALAAIAELEEKGDELDRTLRERLEGSIVTPFDREDIQELTSSLDDIVDEVYAAADGAALHGVSTPLQGLDELVELLVKATTANERLVEGLRSLTDLKPRLDEVERIERAADGAHRRLVAHLFSGAYDALDVLRWNDVVDAVERAVNSVENVAEVISHIAVKHA